MTWLSSEKGQASTLDALLFVSLAAVLAGAMFVYTSDYGVNEGKELQNRFLRSYNSSVYKALLWSPVDRNETGIQDYLLAYSKERFSVDGSLTGVKKQFAENLFTLNASVQDNYEYLFAITQANNANSAPLIVFKSDVDAEGNACGDRNCVYYCDSDAVRLEAFLESPGNKFTSEGVVTLPREGGASDAYRTFMIMWPSRGSDLWTFDSDGRNVCGGAGNAQASKMTCSLGSGAASCAPA